MWFFVFRFFFFGNCLNIDSQIRGLAFDFILCFIQIQF